MTVVRAVLLGAGLLLGGYGLVLLLDFPWMTIAWIATWAATGVLVHDFVFAPLCVALGYAGRRVIPRRWQAAVAVAALCSVTLVLLAIPVFDRPGARRDNATVLDRDYPVGLWLSLAVIWTASSVYLLASQWWTRRRR